MVYVWKKQKLVTDPREEERERERELYAGTLLDASIGTREGEHPIRVLRMKGRGRHQRIMRWVEPNGCGQWMRLVSGGQVV